MYCFNNPITLTDPDGNWPTLPSWNDVKKSASQAYNRTKAYASQKYNEAKNYTTQKYNEAKAYASKKYSETKTAATKAYNDTKKTIIDAKNNAVATTKKTINDGQQWVKSNKKELLKIADDMQNTGDNIAYAGYGTAVVGSAFAGVGAAPGLTIAAEGEFISLVGSGLEIGVQWISGDFDAASSKAGSEAGWYVAGKVVSEGLDRVIPGPTPDITREAAETIQNGKDILIGGAGAKMNIIKSAVEKNNENK